MSNIFPRQVLPLTDRGIEWKDFAERVLYHVDTYAVPQYGDKEEDEIDGWSAKDCILVIKKYAARFGRNSRKNQEKTDMLKIAHYACFIYNKLKEGKDEGWSYRRK